MQGEIQGTGTESRKKGGRGAKKRGWGERRETP
jgi:hypothetical protein